MGRALGALGVCLAVVTFAVACSEDYREDEATAPAADGGSEASAADATSPPSSIESRPGIVECGPELACTIADSYCCISRDGTGRPAYACAKSDGECSANRVRCDEAADCGGGAKCCATLSFQSFAAICDTEPCKAGQACRSDAECGDKKCIKQDCFGLVSFACGKQPFCEAL